LLVRVALGLVLAAALAPWLSGVEEHRRLFVLSLAAAGVATGRVLGRSHPWSGPSSEVAVAALIGLGSIQGTASGAQAMLAVALVLLPVAAGVRWLGPRLMAGALAVALAGTVGAVGAGGLRGLPGLHTWNQYHYVLGTKYFDEVGYHDLYVATLLADADGAGHFAKVREVRDMHTYRMSSREEALARAEAEGLRARFTDARWAEFQHDLEVFYPLLGARTWPGVLTDLGFNPSPAWVAVHRPLLQVFPLDRDTLRAFAALQLPMYAAMLAAALWAFGARTTLWLILWNVLFFGNRGRMYGGYWSYDWLALAVCAVALIARGRAVAAAVPVAVGGLMRGFGGLLALGPAATWAARALRERRLDPWTTRFLLGLAVAMGVLLAASLATARGPDAWSEWYEKISFHSWRISTGGRHLGMKVLFGEDWSVPGHTASLDLRREIYAQQAWAYHLTQAVLLGWLALLLPRRNRVDGALLGFIAAFATMVLSRYYYAAWSVLLLLGTDEGRREARLPVLLGLFGVLALHEGEFLVPGTTPDSRHQDVNLLLLALGLATLLHYTWVDLRARRQRSSTQSGATSAP